MAPLSPFSSPLHSISKTHFRNLRILPVRNVVYFQTKCSGGVSFKSLAFSAQKRKRSYGMRRLRSVEGDTLVPEQAESAPLEVSVPVSPSDTLAIYFQANGTLTESQIPRVIKALEETGGISNLNVQVLEGIGTVELIKQTTVQATGVASSLVEIIQGAGFKLQTLNLSFEAEEDILV